MDIFRESKAYRIVAGDAAQGRLSHAYLLLCPDTANLGAFLRELAAVVVTDGLAGAEAARAARLVAEDRYPDCRFFPAAGEKCGVAEVKAMLEECYIRSVENRRKVFVLSAVHEMLAAAQNKLLKVLEEPPENVVFLLGSASEYAVLSTVRSRTKRLDLHSFPERDIEAYLKEKYPSRPDVKELAALSGGLPGRADELAAGGALAGECDRLAQLMLTLSPAAIPAEARRAQGREEAARMLSLLRLVCRDLLMLRLGREDLLLSGADGQTLARVARRYTEAALVRALGRIGQCERELRANSVVPQSIEALLHGILEDQ